MSKPRPEMTIRRSRRRLINRYQKLAQMDLFEPMSPEIRKTLTKLEGQIAIATRELELRRRA